MPFIICSLIFLIIFARFLVSILRKCINDKIIIVAYGYKVNKELLEEIMLLQVHAVIASVNM